MIVKDKNNKEYNVEIGDKIISKFDNSCFYVDVIYDMECNKFLRINSKSCSTKEKAFNSKMGFFSYDRLTTFKSDLYEDYIIIKIIKNYDSNFWIKKDK